jgi:alpha-tubulin suppressor-like RCC1 family protein
VRTGYDSNWAQISAGKTDSLAIKTDGSLWTWGDSVLISYLLRDVSIGQFVPVRVRYDNNWAHISTGYWHSLAVRTDGSLWAWGQNDYGQLGDSTRIQRLEPMRAGLEYDERDWSVVASGGHHSVAIKADGSLWTWGDDNYERLDASTDTDRNAPARIGSENNWAGVAAGHEHSLAIKTDGSLWAWGWNYHGQLGDGTDMARHALVRVGIDNNRVP